MFEITYLMLTMYHTQHRDVDKLAISFFYFNTQKREWVKKKKKKGPLCFTLIPIYLIKTEPVAVGKRKKKVISYRYLTGGALYVPIIRYKYI